MRDFIRESIENRTFILYDGGMGTLLQENGLAAGELPETMAVRRPEVLSGIHRQYLEAGANIILTDTFGANRLKFPEGGEYSLEEIVNSAVRAAISARDSFIKENPGAKAYISLDIGPTGRLLKPMGDLGFEEAVDFFAETVRLGRDAGVDCITIETMGDTYELKAAVLAAKENSELPVFATAIFGENGKLLTGADPAAVAALLEGLRVDALGVNCGFGPDLMRPVIEAFSEASSLPLILNPNAGLPEESTDGKVSYSIDAAEFAAAVKEIAAENSGVIFAGGCCGTTPEYIKALKAELSGIRSNPPERKSGTVVSSGMRHVYLDRGPVIIGERLNPTGKKKLKEALKSGDMEYILRTGASEEEQGAHILDVNVGLPDIDEAAVLSDTVSALQGITPLPLQIDTSSPKAMERALRIYNGKPMINSVNGKQESMDQVFPLAAKYGGAVVALLLDESGIPETVSGRLAVLDRILAEAAKYGIDQKDIVPDALTLTISTDIGAAKITLETVRRIHEDYGLCTVLGVSNISFGLPRRDLINAAFYTEALAAGLSAGIINPGAELMMSAYDSHMTLSGLDPQCGNYINKYAGTTAAAQVTAAAPAAANGSQAPEGAGAKGNLAALKAAIIKGLKDGAVKYTEEALGSGAEPMSIIDGALMPALNEVGEAFEKGTAFLPQLLISAESAKACFSVIKSHMPAAGSPGASASKGRIILATVKGDIHDIGKNIVKVLLENYSYEVIDLGKDVPPEKIVETAREQNIRLIGLSALMTTTVSSMEDTIRAVRESGTGSLVMVGGAVLTQKYADMIGADAYCRDAMAAVRYADSVFGE
ncbi:MAG: homocysteine S-methyltransferase family protein [Lachnospiraceae bacterium]|nr:homocysteine S-methyltransferase family protein [Lachnospiraceae bacterium]